MIRKKLIARLARLAGIALAGGLATSAVAVEKDGRPNIVVILADDLGYSDIGSYGGEIETPNLDRLAAGGLRFTQFYNAGRCVPTRGSLLTGLYAHQAGVGEMVTPSPARGYGGRLSEQAVTLAEVLGLAGYQSFMSGKWHLTHYDYGDPGPTLHRDTWPLQRGFDRFFGTLSGAGSYYHVISLMKGNGFIPSQPRFEGREIFYYTDEINDHAARFIRQAEEGKPLFLYVAHVAPHWPLHALPEDIAKYDDVYSVGWDEIRRRRHQRMVEKGLIRADWPLAPRDPKVKEWAEAEHKEWEAHRMAVYAAMVDRMDQGIGRVVGALRETGRYENTLILFLSDNGGTHTLLQGRSSRHGYFARGGTRPGVFPGGPDTYAAYGPEWGHVSNTPFRLYKQCNHEGGVATPLIAHWPMGISDSGALRHQPGHVIDIMATAVDLAGAEYPTVYNNQTILPMEGVSLRPAFDNQLLDRGAIYFEHIGHRAIRTGTWKLVAERGQAWELYDMEADRTELNNLAGQYPDVVEQLSRDWQAWARRAYVDR